MSYSRDLTIKPLKLQLIYNNPNDALIFFFFFSCECPTGFDGPRCQQLRHSFNGGGWAWYPTLEQCDDDILSLQFATRLANSLLLYNGPQNTQELGDFIALELANGYPVLRYNFGGGVGSLEINGRNSQGQKTLNALNDGNWHTLQVLKQGMVSHGPCGDHATFRSHWGLFQY